MSDNVNPIIGVIVLVGVIGLLICGFVYQASIQKNLINERFGTNYTTKDLYWGGDVIKDMLEGNKNRIGLEIK